MEKHKKIDTKAIEYHIAGILKALGDNPEREGLIDTPKRVELNGIKDPAME